MNKLLENPEYQSLKSQIGELLILRWENAGRAVNSILVQSYWHIGKHIVEFEQGGNEKSEYGKLVLDRLSEDLTLEFGKGFSKSNLTYMRKIFLFYPNRKTLSHKLTWSHYFKILKVDNGLEISFYTKESEKEKWSVRELKRQMKSMLFHRIALSKDKEAVLKLSEKGRARSTILVNYPFHFLIFDRNV